MRFINLSARAAAAIVIEVHKCYSCPPLQRFVIDLARKPTRVPYHTYRRKPQAVTPLLTACLPLCDELFALHLYNIEASTC
jgi:hypothetical protein